MDSATALCGFGAAFFALVMEGAVDGAVARGLPQTKARRMAAQTRRGMAELVLGWRTPGTVGG
jgi:pyrroline-5-carboxylate reductase